MESVEAREVIAEGVLKLKRLSSEQQVRPLLRQEKVDRFLDKFSLFLRELDELTAQIEETIQQLEGLTWLREPEKEDHELVMDIISLSREWHSGLKRQYVQIKRIIGRRPLAIEALRLHKAAIDDLEEAYCDLEDVFVHLPQDPDFIHISSQLDVL